MSGGSFNYLQSYNCLENLEHLRGMQQELADLAYDHPQAQPAADATWSIIAAIDKALERARELDEVWHAVEWWKSGDWGQEDALREAAKFAERTQVKP
jgi:hypothetical protein